MNMITVLLGATGILLVVAVALSFGAMNKGADAEEAARLRKEIAALKMETPSPLPSSGDLLPPTFAPDPVSPDPVPVPVAPIPGTGSAAQGGPVTANPASVPAPTTSPSDQDVPELGNEAEIRKLEEELRALEKENGQLTATKERVEKENQILKNEVGVAWQPMIEANAKNSARARTIKEAMLQARVTQWSDEGGFAVIEIHQPDSVQQGTVLAIRRQSGIYGQVKVDQMYEAGQAVANPIVNTFLGKDGVDIQPGDELILPPL